MMNLFADTLLIAARIERRGSGYEASPWERPRATWVARIRSWRTFQAR